MSKVVSASLLLLVLEASAGTSIHPKQVAARGRLIPLEERGERQFKVDGDLSDWGDLITNGIVLHQLLDHTGGPVIDGAAADVALIKLFRDERSLFVAIRVKDAVVLNPYAEDEFNGDCIELFLDLRPPSGTGSTLGETVYADGAYQLLIVPPTKDKNLRWREVDKGFRKIGPIEVAGRLTDSGYEIELALPFSSLLEQAPSDRPGEPVGFEVMIDDMDAEGGAPEQRAYSWSGRGGYSGNPNQFACALPGYPATIKRPLLRGPKFRKEGDRVMIGFATIPGTEVLVSGQELASAFDRPELGTNIVSAPLVTTKLPEERCDELGVVFHWHEVNGNPMLPGRYRIDLTIPTAAEHLARARFYGAGGLPLPAEPTVRWSGTVATVPTEWLQPSRAGTAPLLTDAEFAKAMAKSAAFMWLADFYAPAEKPVNGRFRIIAEAPLWFEMSETAGRGSNDRYKLRLQLVAEKGNAIASQLDVPLRPRPMEFAFPTDGLATRSYTLTAGIVGSDGQVVPMRTEAGLAKGKMTVTPDLPFVIVPPREWVRRTTVRDAAGLLTNAVVVGDPTRAQFPNDDVSDCQARSIHDLQAYVGRIYIGCGDWTKNRGPIDIWSFAPGDTNQSTSFVKEFTVDDESVDRLRDYGGILYVPGLDSADPVDKQWELGNLYTKTGGKWQKYRTVPNGIHVLDVAVWRTNLYVTTGTEAGAALFESGDGGSTWRPCPGDGAAEGRFYEAVALDDFLFLTSGRSHRGGYQYRDGAIQPLWLDLLPGMECGDWSRLERLQRFHRGVVYTVRYCGGTAEPMFYLEDFERGAETIELFQDKFVRDIVVRGSRCFVLVADRKPDDAGKFRGEIYSSESLADWLRVAEFVVPALPNSLEVMNEVYYIGLANHDPWKSADTASGTILRLETKQPR